MVKPLAVCVCARVARGFFVFGLGCDVVVGLVVFGGCGVCDVEGVCDGCYCAFGFLVGDLFFGGEGSVGEVLGDLVEEVVYGAVE